jgi:predicted RNA-binding protein with RPS1 domain
MEFSEVEQLQYLSLCSKVTAEIFAQIGIRDKVLTEYVIDQALEAADEDSFIQKMNEDEGGFSLQFCISLFNNVQKMLPAAYLKRRKTKEAIKESERSSGLAGQKIQRIGENDEIIPNYMPKDLLAKRFPALALPNKNEEEIELDLDDMVEEKKEEANPTQAKLDDGLEKAKFKRKESLTSDSGSKASIRSGTISPQPKSRSSSRDKKTKKRKEEKHSSKDLKRSKYRRSVSSSKSYSRSRSRSSSRDRKGRDKDRRSKRDRRDRDSKHRRDRDRSRNRRRSSSRSYSRDRRDSKNTPQLSKIYNGYITMKLKDGVLVQLSDWRGRMEGLVHVNGLDNKGTGTGLDSLKEGDKVKVKVVSLDGKKMYLSMKDIDQRTGEDLKAKRKAEVARQLENAIFKDSLMGDGRTHGALTGIRLADEGEEQKRAGERLNSPDLWEMSRLKYFAGHEIGPIKRVEDMETRELNEEDVEIELNDKEPSFLVGQTSKTGVNMSPIRVVVNPEGSLQMEAIKGLQFAKERRENRELNHRAQLEATESVIYRVI